MLNRAKLAAGTLFFCACAASLATLAAVTAPIRTATWDDYLVARSAEDPPFALAQVIGDLRIGRFYAQTKWGFLESLVSLPADLRAAVRIGLFSAALGAMAWFLFAWTRNARLGLLGFLLGAVLAPIAIGYQALVTLPQLCLGWAAVWAMAALAAGPDSAGRRWAAAACFTAALLIHESNAAFVAWPFLVRWLRFRGDSFKTQLRWLTPSAVVLSLYVLIFLFIRSQAMAAFPGETYDGAQPAFHAGAALRALFAYSWSGLPGITAWFARSSDPASGVFLTGSQWLYSILLRSTTWDFAGALLAGGALWALLPPALPEGTGHLPAPFGLAAALLFAVHAPNLLMSGTVKYQEWALQRMWPYYSSGMSYLAWTALGAVGIFALARGAWGGRPVPARAFAATALVVLAASVFGANREAAAYLQAHRFDHMLQYRQYFPSAAAAPRCPR
jgi:hypothetical protein